MTREEKKHRRVLQFLAVMRGAFPDATIIFSYGACYGLYQILHEVFPDATPYMAFDEEHVVTRIGSKYYDIRGEFIRLNGKPKDEAKKLTPEQMEYWSSCAAIQRVEYMIKKYNT